MDTLIVVLIVGATAAFVAIKAVKAARTVARGGAPACCGGEPATPAGRIAESAAGRPAAVAAPEGSCEDRAVAAGLPSPCASCPGCAGH
jgi:hypothetical protein